MRGFLMRGRGCGGQGVTGRGGGWGMRGWMRGGMGGGMGGGCGGHLLNFRVSAAVLARLLRIMVSNRRRMETRRAVRSS